jgi:polyhydroxybutyrate depolymerase
MSALNAAADERGMIVVYPQGTGAIPAWNVDEVPAGPDDTAFIGALIDELEATLCIDSAQLFVTGFSNGGGMAQKLSCDIPERLAAAAPVAATYLACTGPVPVIAFHGTADMSAPYEGGQTASGVVFPPVRRALSEWGRALGCDGLPLISRQGSEIELSTFVNCPAGEGEALLYTVLGGGHTWPGSPAPPDAAIAGPTTQAIDASARMLDFFLEHPLIR